MEKLKISTMLYALKNLNLDDSEINQKDVQESIFQLEDINAEKAFIKNCSKIKMKIDSFLDISNLPRLFNHHTNDKQFALGVNDKRVSDVYLNITSSGQTNKEKVEIITNTLINWIYANGDVIDSKILKGYIKQLKEVEKESKLSETPTPVKS